MGGGGGWRQLLVSALIPFAFLVVFLVSVNVHFGVDPGFCDLLGVYVLLNMHCIVATTVVCM